MQLKSLVNSKLIKDFVLCDKKAIYKHNA